MKCESQPQERPLERHRRNTGRGRQRRQSWVTRKQRPALSVCCAPDGAEPAEGCHYAAARPVLSASPPHRRRNKVTGNQPAKGLSGGSQAQTRAAWLLRASEKERARVRGREDRLSPRGARWGHGGQHVTKARPGAGGLNGLPAFPNSSQVFLLGIQERETRTPPILVVLHFCDTCFKIIMSNH